jgi:hypothetical protein
LTFVAGKGVVKQRAAVKSIRRYLIENVMVQLGDQTWAELKRELSARIAEDARAELVRVSAAFRRGVIGIPENSKGLRGTLTTAAKGSGAPQQALGGLPRWALRTEKYLRKKQQKAKHKRWFDNTGWAPRGGTLKSFFESDTVDRASGGASFVGSAGIFEDLFGPIRVTVTRQSSPTGATTNFGAGNSHKIQLAKVRVSALSRVQDSMLNFSERPNAGLLRVVASGLPGEGSQAIAYRLRGGKGRYRPTLEPFLEFYLRKSLPFAVSKRIEKAVSTGTLFRRGGQR